MLGDLAIDFELETGINLVDRKAPLHQKVNRLVGIIRWYSRNKGIHMGEEKFSYADFFQPYSTLTSRELAGQQLPAVRRRPNFRRGDKSKQAIAVNLLIARNNSSAAKGHREYGSTHTIDRPTGFG